MGDSGPTITKDEQLLAFPYCYLGKQWEEIVWYTLGVFTHDAARVGACRIEIAKQSGVPVVSGFSLLLEIIALGFDVIGDTSFHGRLGASVGVGRADWAVFRNGYHVFEAGGVAVDGGRRGEDDFRDIVACHGGQKADGAVDIRAVVFKRDLARFTNSLRLVSEESKAANNSTFGALRPCMPYLESSEMDHAVNVWMCLEDSVEVLLFPDVGLKEMGSLSTDKLNSIEGLF